ncbi:tRNA (cytidine(34)-2'-O)-methyltransferase [Cystobacter fuscus]
MYAARLEEGDHLVFGSETQGLPPEVMTGGSGTAVTLPMLPERRSLNLSTAVGIAAYEALRRWASASRAGGRTRRVERRGGATTLRPACPLRRSPKPSTPPTSPAPPAASR